MFNFNKKVAATRVAVASAAVSKAAGKLGDISQEALEYEYHEARRENNNKFDRVMNGFCVPGGVAATALCKGVEAGAWSLADRLMKRKIDKSEVVRD